MAPARIETLKAIAQEGYPFKRIISYALIIEKKIRCELSKKEH
jgi:hypothetical protein